MARLAPRRPPATIAAAAAAALALAFAAACLPAAAAATSSALLVVDPQPGDPCSRTPGECGTLDSCASAFRVDVLSNGTAVITPSGPDYTLSCATDYNAAYPTSLYSFDPRVSSPSSVRVRCSAMTGSGAEGAWPPAAKKDQQQQQPALVFDKFAVPDFDAKGLDGKPMPGGGTVSHSLLSGPDNKMTASALFNRRAFTSGVCFPFWCPTPSCFMGRPSALVVVRVAERGSGRVQVLSGERAYTCDSWRDGERCGRAQNGFSYRVVEGSLLGEKAQAANSKIVVGKDTCPVGMGPAKITVPPAAGGGGNGGGVAAGPRDACVSACDGAAAGAKGTRDSNAVVYDPSGAPKGGCRACPSGFVPKGAACAACAGWQGLCCAPGFGPGATKDCPACPSSGPKKAFARLRLASVVAPSSDVKCADLLRASVGELAQSQTPGYLDDAARAKAAEGCPPRELVVATNSACGVELSAPDCPALQTTRPEEWPAPGKLAEGALGTLPFNLTAGIGGPAGAAWTLRTNLLTRFTAASPYGDPERSLAPAALEATGPGGRGLLALRFSPSGCVFRYGVVEGGLPGAAADVPAGGAPLPAAASWCPGSSKREGSVTVKGLSVPLCVVPK